MIPSCMTKEDRLLVSRIAPAPIETKGVIRLAQDKVMVYVDGDDTVIEATGMANYILMHETDAVELLKAAKGKE